MNGRSRCVKIRGKNTKEEDKSKCKTQEEELVVSWKLKESQSTGVTAKAIGDEVTYSQHSLNKQAAVGTVRGSGDVAVHKTALHSKMKITF